MTGSFVNTSNEITPTMSVIAGSLSGLIVRFLIAPIDIVKIRLQLQKDPVKYHSIISTSLSIFKNEGIRAFWKGNVPAELMYLVYGGAQFTSYTFLSNLSEQLERQHNLKIPHALHSVLVGSLSGCSATCISYPLDLLRTRLASNDKRGFESLVQEILKITKNEGIPGFFGGSAVSMIYVAASTGITFGTYRYMIDKTSGSGWESISGVTAGVFSKMIIYPVDLVKRRLQMGYKLQFRVIACSILRKEGIRGLYHGLVPALVKSAPSTAVSLWTYEFFIKYFKTL